MPNTDLIRIQKIKLGGKIYIDIRRCIEPPSGKPIPTARGVSVPLEVLDAVLEKALAANGEAEYVVV